MCSWTERRASAARPAGRVGCGRGDPRGLGLDGRTGGERRGLVEQGRHEIGQLGPAGELGKLDLPPLIEPGRGAVGHDGRFRIPHFVAENPLVALLAHRKIAEVRRRLPGDGAGLRPDQAKSPGARRPGRGQGERALQLVAEGGVAAADGGRELDLVADLEARRLQDGGQVAIQHRVVEVVLPLDDAEFGRREHVNRLAAANDPEGMGREVVRRWAPDGRDVARREGFRPQNLEPIGRIGLLSAWAEPGLAVEIDHPQGRAVRIRRRCGSWRRRDPGRNRAILNDIGGRLRGVHGHNHRHQGAKQGSHAYPPRSPATITAPGDRATYGAARSAGRPGRHAENSAKPPGRVCRRHAG